MNSILANVFANPAITTTFELSDWDLLIRQARNSGLLSKVHFHLEQHNLLRATPGCALKHLMSAKAQTNRHRDLVHYEVKQIHKALRELETPVIILKGAAYVAAGLPASEGRFFVDIDIMVHKSRIALAEDALQHAGWINSNVDAYDEKYYRTWMHEIPPMQHGKRGTLLDLHHTILPETARFKPDANKLFKAAIPIPGYTNLYTLCPEDMVLHSATHLFSDGEFEHGLRDLVDIDNLLQHFPRHNPDFWERLIARARNMDLSQPLYYALHYCRSLLSTPIPEAALETAKAQAQSSALAFSLVSKLLDAGLQPNHSSCRGVFDGLSMWLLYVRSHYLRMPLKLLIPHLFHKAVITPYHEHKREKEAAKHTDLRTLLALRNR